MGTLASSRRYSGRKCLRYCPPLIWLAVFALPLPAQTTLPALPAGWTSQDLGTAIILKSQAANSPGQVALTILPTGQPIGERKKWFAQQTLALAQTGGRPLASTDVTEPQPGVLIRVIEVENKQHVRLRNVFYGYPVARGTGITILTIPPSVSDQDPQLQVANSYVKELAATKFEITPTPTAQAPASGPVRNSQGQYVGQFGKTDIDLTYHAKAIIPKERDVPLKGVYLFVGFAYGASYGGVGTTMTWGQQATQQLLLLFENGVAAKTDLRGGNLAGKYQAEGFATMDVANPAAVAGSPYGHWTEEGNAVHIQWNVGAPADLVRNGDNLEAKGQRWTPYRLVEGERLEGTFVRRMEAGLRSQSIVLHNDGTFAGDGVNVTMGGSQVNPNFPERGSGTYAVHKGSMILFFANGFTQSIVCIIDKASNGEAKTVLLNGFPFERVR